MTSRPYFILYGRPLDSTRAVLAQFISSYWRSALERARAQRLALQHGEAEERDDVGIVELDRELEEETLR